MDNTELLKTVQALQVRVETLEGKLRPFVEEDDGLMLMYTR